MRDKCGQQDGDLRRLLDASENITGLPADAADRMVFHAGTSGSAEAVQISGGGVLFVTALAETVALAQRRAYEVVDGIHFDGMQHRRDIGYRAL